MARPSREYHHEDGATESSIILPGMGVDFDGKDAAEKFQDQFVTVDKPDMELIKLDKFMNEPVTVVVNDSTNPLEYQSVDLNHNGDRETLLRGVPKKIKRKFLYVLCTAKPEVVYTDAIVLPDGSKSTSLRKTQTHKYSFSVEEDANPIGHKFVQSWRAEAV